MKMKTTRRIDRKHFAPLRLGGELISNVSRRGAKAPRWASILAILLVTMTVYAQKAEHGVRVVPNEAAKRVDVFVDGQPFTSYIWPDTLMKPVLYPVRTARGTIVTRGFPMDPRPGERIDHPHQVGVWFNYGDVNGVDFWNNSTARTAAEKQHMGTIAQRRIVSTKNGKKSGELEVETEWIMPDGKACVREHTRFIFRAGPNLRTIDRITTLTALDQRVVFRDTKEGLLGMRVRRELEQPSTESLTFTDDQGRPTSVPKMDNTGVTGLYRSSAGKTGDDVWGTRGNWATLSGKVGDESITLAILDHPQNTGYPTYWMARGYGLFAANPLGQKAYSTEKKEATVRELNFTLEPKQSATFRFRMLILSEAATPEQMEKQSRDFAEVK
jgi:Methane oxygenase PmoA